MDATPDKLALLFVQQWLHEHGYSSALHALEKESHLLYDDTKLEKSSQLLQLVYRHMEEVAFEPIFESGSQEAQEAQEEEAMLRGGRRDYPQVELARITGVHTSSVVCVRLVPGKDEVLTGAGEGVVRRTRFSGEVVWQQAVGSGGVLCMDVHPAAQCIQHNSAHHNEADTALRSSHLLPVGSMDGTLTILHMATGQVLASSKAHSKYLVRLAWNGEGQYLVSCSHDQSVGIHLVELEEAAPGSELRVKLTTVKRVEYTVSVQDAAFLSDGFTLVVALRDTNYLRVLSLDDLEASEVKVNLNAKGDDHVSFFARHLVPSPCGRFLLVCTDTGRMLVLRVKGSPSHWRLAPFPLYSLPTEQFHQFCAAWHHDSHYVFAGAAGAQVWVYHVGSGKVVARLPVHKVNVRDLDYDADRNLLVTGSFDKSVVILGPQPAK